MSVALITTISLATSAFASPTYTATTTYVGNSTVSVKATISAATKDEQVTFLVADETATPTIVYIDQDVIGSDGTKTFTFTSSLTGRLVGMLNATTKIKFGTTSISATTITGTSTTSPLDGTQHVQFNLLNLPTAIVMSDPDYAVKSINHVSTDENVLKDNSIITFGTATTQSGAVPASEFGILWSTNNSASNGIAQTFTVAKINSFTPSGGSTGTDIIRKYPAMLSNAGQFGIKIVDGGTHLLRTGIVYTRTYAIYNNGVTDVVSLGDVRTVEL